MTDMHKTLIMTRSLARDLGFTKLLEMPGGGSRAGSVKSSCELVGDIPGSIIEHNIKPPRRDSLLVKSDSQRPRDDKKDCSLKENEVE